MIHAVPENKFELAKIGSLWIGGPLSWLEVASLNSFVALGHDVVLYTYGDVGNVPAGVDLRDAREVWDTDKIIFHKESGSPAVHSDIFRVMMNAQSGRVWVDTDIIALRPFESSLKWFIGHERTDKVELGNAVLGLPPESKLITLLHDFLTDENPVPPWSSKAKRDKIAELRLTQQDFGFGDMAWGVSGPKALTYYAIESGEIDKAQAQEVFFPVAFQDRKDLLHSGKADELGERFSSSNSYAVHLYSRWLRKNVHSGTDGLPPRDSWLGRFGASHGLINYPILQKNISVLEPIAPKVDLPIAVDNGEAEIIEQSVKLSAETAMQTLPQRKALVPGGENISRHGRVCIVTMAKDEGPYILEWVVHHHILGFTDIVVYTNNCTDGTDEMLDALAELGLLSRHDNPVLRDKPPQSRALTRSENHPIVQAADWLLVMDFDEFVSVKTGNNRIDDLIDEIKQRDATGVCLTWRFFGSSDANDFGDGPVTERFVHAAPDTFSKGYGFKTLFKTDDRLYPAIHRPRMNMKFARSEEGLKYSIQWMNGSGKVLDGRNLRWRLGKNEVGYDLAQMNHYGVKSREEYLLRRLRGDVLDKSSKYDDQYFGIFDRNDVEDKSALALADKCKSYTQELLKNPKVRQAADMIEDRRKARLEKLRSTDGYADSISSLKPFTVEDALRTKWTNK